MKSSLKIKRSDKYYILVFLTLIVGVISRKMAVSQLMITIMSIIAFLCRYASIQQVGLVALIMPSEIWVCIMLLFTLMLGRCNGSKLFFPKIDGNDKICIGMIFVLGLCNAIYSGMINNFLFYAVYVIILIFILFVFRKIYIEKDIADDLKKLVTIQFFMVIIQVIQTKSLKPNDDFHGTLHDAHVFGVWLLLSITYLFVCEIKGGKRKWEKCLAIAQALICLYLADAKHVVIAFVFGILAYEVIRSFCSDNNSVAVTIVFVMVSLYLGTLFIAGPGRDMFTKMIDNRYTYSIYFYDPEYNLKFSYIKGTLFENLTGIRLFTGYGLGEYGSRGANLFAYDIAYRDKNAINDLIARVFPASTIAEYKKYASLYSDEIAKNITFRSAVLTYPFSSLIAFIAENGLIGCTCWIFLLNKHFKTTKLKGALAFFIVLCFFDLYIDRIYTISMLIVILYAGSKSSNEKNTIYHSVA